MPHPELPHNLPKGPSARVQEDGDQKENWRQQGLAQTHRGFRKQDVPQQGHVPEGAIRYQEEDQ